MPGQQIHLLKIFIASPGDVKLEREKAREEILGLQPVAQKLGYMLEAVGWETHATPGMGRSQELLNKLVRECDLFIGVLWRKFGSPTGEAESGTLEEFNLARERHAKERAPEIMLYFREVHPDFLSDPGPQLQKVLEFKQQIEDGRLALYQNYRDPEHLAHLLRQHVTNWLLKLVPAFNTTATSAKPKIFISHISEDKFLVRRLESELTAAGVEVWVDHAGIFAGDNLPKLISDALEWCNTLLLIWSETTRDSHWVEIEWTSAIALKKTIIPCLLNDIKLPGILAHKAYLDFRDIDAGIAQLLQTLNLNKQLTTSTATDPLTVSVPVLQNQLIDALFLIKPKPPQYSPLIKLRTQPINNLFAEDVKKMLKEKNFYDNNWNKNGKCPNHQYEVMKYYENKLIIDYATGLTWQRSGSDEAINYEKSQAYIEKLNKERFGGFYDWRLPTLEEAMSLMEPPEKENVLYIDSLFDQRQTWIWTADNADITSAWVAYFSSGYCLFINREYCPVFVRAVR